MTGNGNGKPTRGLRAAARTARLGWVNHDGPLRDVLGELAATLAGGTALLSTPTEFVVARVDADGGCHTPARPVEDVDRAVDFAYEARVFTADVELRWVRRGTGGHGVLLGEEVRGGAEATGLRVFDADSGYLLWGKRLGNVDGDEVADGWAVLSAARVGTLRIPVDATTASSSASRLRLRVREYIAVGSPPTDLDADRKPGRGDGTNPDGGEGDGGWDVGWHGNAYMFEERLIGFEAGEFVHG